MEFFPGYADLHHGPETVFPAVPAVHLSESGKLPCQSGQGHRQRFRRGEHGHHADTHVHPHDRIRNCGAADPSDLSHVPAVFCKRNHGGLGERLTKKYILHRKETTHEKL